VVHPDGYLLAIKKSDGTLFKAPLHRPTAARQVAIVERFEGGDGLRLVGKNDLVVIANRTPEHAANAAEPLHRPRRALTSRRARRVIG
jgi:hypothetical protein